MKRILLEDALILSAVKLARALVRFLPERAALALGRGLGSFAYLISKRRVIAYRNLRAAFASEKPPAELRRIAKRSVQTMGMTLVEMLRFPEQDRAWVDSHITNEGEEKLTAGLNAGKGVIFLTGHYGNWEFLNIVGGLMNYPLSALARPQKHPRSDAYLNDLRQCKGAKIIMKGMMVREILRSLKGGGIVAIVNDQDGGKTGTPVEFFGRLSSTASGVVTFAIRTGAPILPIFITRQGVTSAHHIEVKSPLVMPDASASPEEAERFVLQQFAAELEKMVRKHPEQWLWAHRRWKSSPDRSVLVLSDGKTGHLNQSLAVFDGIREERHSQGAPESRLRSTIVEVNYRNDVWRRVLSLIFHLSGGRPPFQAALMRAALDPRTYDALEKSYTDVVISCGSSLLPVNLFVKELNAARSVVVMKPSLPLKRFDAVIVPRHDKIKNRSNVFVTERALSVVTSETMKRETARLNEEFPGGNGRLKIGLLIGGDTSAMRFDRERFKKVLAELLRCADEEHALIFATSSRRTPKWADEILKGALGDRSRCPLLVIANESNRAGIVGGILGYCDAVVVSGESVSMVSEAVSSGKPVVVFMPSEDFKMKTKTREFLRRMADGGLIAHARPADIAGVLRREMKQGNGARAAFLVSDREALRRAARRVA
jgi:KDO2-lipid IV(A) lauroyltransferase